MSINNLDINGFNIITSFLQPYDIKRLWTVSKYVYSGCKNFMTYSYNQYGTNKSYLTIYGAKWMIDKKLKLVKITFDDSFNQTMETLRHCKNLQQITFGWNFNQPIEALSHCTNLHQITFGWLFVHSIHRSPSTNYFW